MSKEIIESIEDRLPVKLKKEYSRERLQKEAVPFIGSPRKHKTDREKIFLKTDPVWKSNQLLEFNISDIIFVEDMQTIIREGVASTLIRLWIRKGSVAVKMEPFYVQDIPESAIVDYIE